ncbi:MAG: AarF/UbiB family protein [Thermoanaerobaculia bacterium]|nr:AarF/UbiB family protein [Thermoanaerobaculia bacterium]
MPELDRARFRTVRRFFRRVILHLLLFDLLLPRIGLGRIRPDPLPRWQELAREFREMASELGGFLIKLGQVLSTRVDLLPREVTGELTRLQDEVTPVPFAAIRRGIADELGDPDELFRRIEEKPLGSASLAQAHRAVRPDGDTVVVKVLRPGIETVVATDLAAVTYAGRWLKRWRAVARRVDVDRLIEELRTVTERELDLEQEAAHARRFAEIFAGDERVSIPTVDPDRSSRRVLTSEDVSGIKVDDLEALEAAGVDPGEVADRLYGIYLEQVFEHFFVHADPHPGNLFVRPLERADDEEGEEGNGGRAFRLAFVDFGMVAEIPPRLRSALRDYLIALGTRDARRMVESYREAGLLLPGADLRRLEEAHEALFQELWGLTVGELGPGATLQRLRGFFREYRDLVREAPFQFPVDLLFAGRAVGILAGIATRLDPDFEPWSATRPYAERAARARLFVGPRQAARQVLEQTGALLRIPRELDRILPLLRRGSLTLRSSLAPDARERLQAIETQVRSLKWTVAGVGLILTGVLLRQELEPAAWTMGLAGGLALLRGLWP